MYNASMKETLVKIINLLPVIAFFITYKTSANLVLSTAVIVGGCLAATAIEYALTRKVSRMQIFLVVMVLLFGLPTVLLRDPSIIKWKVTVVNLVFATLIFVCQFLLKKNPFSYLLGREIELPEDGWNFLAKAWMIFFVCAGLLNVVIAFYLPQLFGISESEAESLWVDYKTFGNGILNFLFAIITIWVVFRRHPELLKENLSGRVKK